MTMTPNDILEMALQDKFRKAYGFNIVFCNREKKAMHKWTKWQIASQSDEDVKRLFKHAYRKNEITCYSYICGYRNLVSLDVDWPFVYRLWRKRFEERSETLTVKCPSGGNRPYYLVTEPIKDDTYKNDVHFEVKGKGAYAVANGIAENENEEMKDYILVDKNMPIKIDDNIIIDAVKFIKELKSKYHFLFYHCIYPHFNKKMWKEVKHEVRMYVANIMVYENFDDDEIIEFFRAMPDFKEHITKGQIGHTRGKIETGELKPPKCDTMRKTLNFSKSKCKGCNRHIDSKKKKSKKEDKKEDTEKIENVSRLITNSFIAEEIFDPPNAPQFVKKYFGKDGFTYIDEIKLGEKDVRGREIIYRPIDNEHLRKGMVILPRKPVECAYSELAKECMSFVTDNFDACDKINELNLNTLIVTTSWILDKEKPLLPIAGVGVFAVILPIRGPSGSGKNRLANLLRFLSYHPYFVLSTTRIPSLYRPLADWQGSLVIDEGDLANSGETAEVIHFLNSRATGTPIGRQNPDNPRTSNVFPNFGQTIITQRRVFDDNATEGRSVQFLSDISEKKISTLLPDDVIHHGMELQDKLLYIRLTQWENITIDKTKRLDYVDDHRLHSVLLPLEAMLSLCKDNEINIHIKDSVKKIQEARKVIKSYSEDGMIINYLWNNIESGLHAIKNNFVYVTRMANNEYDRWYEDDEPLTVPLAAGFIGWELRISAKQIRKIITSLNISPEDAPTKMKVKKRTYRPIVIDIDKFHRRAKEFVVNYDPKEIFDDIKKSIIQIIQSTLPKSGEK